MDPTGAAPVTAEKRDVEKKATEPGAVVGPVSTPTATAGAGDDSDPDEDDLDDLDDMLEDFSTVKLDSTKTADAAAKSSGPAPVKPDVTVNPEDLTEEDFAQQLQDGMASLLGELGQSPEMQAEFENLFKGMAPAAANEGGASGAGSSGTAGEAHAELR
ncbi:hypothetical protein NQ176_g7753 [Zarea fungicola]|uniref:Uncharacterized protein n=1 Tax=Zarea fungicola TaxID=93591 RepID=A0ACC1MYK6_9HYPO|nr:hypothetical protein NQ176_g7753 [Lecanicillium fungicola]